MLSNEIWSFNLCVYQFIIFNFRNFLDKNKVERIKDKSGAPADLLDLYDNNKPTKIDLFSDRWDFAEHMDFFIPACARTAYTVSLGNKQSKTNIKKSISRELYDEMLDVELNDPDPVSVLFTFYLSNSLNVTITNNIICMLNESNYMLQCKLCLHFIFVYFISLLDSPSHHAQTRRRPLELLNVKKAINVWTLPLN